MNLDGIEHTHTADPDAIAITSLARVGDTLWCGLTAGRRSLVPFDLRAKRFGAPVDVFPWVVERPQPVLSKLHNALGALPDGRLVLGEGILYSWDGIPFELAADHNTPHQDRRRALRGLPPLDHRHGPRDLSTFDLRTMTGGVVAIHDPASGRTTTVGRVPPMTYVQSLIVDGARGRAYGHTLGDCHFIVVDLARGSVEDHGRISTFAFHNLVVAPDGVVFGAWIDVDLGNKLRALRYDPAKGFLERLPAVLLDDPGPRVQGNKGVDQWLVHSSGAIFVGMAGDGFVYRFDRERLSLSRVGRIGTGGRVTSMVEDERGRMVFSGGFPVMHVGRLDPRTGAVEDFGPVSRRYDKIYFHGAAYRDGTLWLAETDSGVASLWEARLPD